MQANLMGFIWSLGTGITLEEFFNHLATLNGKPEKFGEYDRLLSVGTRGDYYVGLFLKIKDQRRSPEITNAGGKFTISVRSLAEGTNLVDFNFFIINKKTQRGMYQYYHQSCSLNQFCIFCAQQYEGLKESKIEAALAGVGGDAASTADKKRIKKAYKGSLSYENMVRSETLQALLDELEQIKYFDFTLAAIDDNDALLTPLRPYAKKQRRIVRFKATQVGVVNAIVNIVKAKGIRVGRVGGVDAEKREHVYRLIENPDKFAEFEYDEIADETILNVAKVEESPFFDEMLGVIDGDAAIKAMFETQVRA